MITCHTRDVVELCTLQFRTVEEASRITLYGLRKLDPFISMAPIISTFSRDMTYQASGLRQLQQTVQSDLDLTKVVIQQNLSSPMLGR